MPGSRSRTSRSQLAPRHCVGSQPECSKSNPDATSHHHLAEQAEPAIWQTASERRREVVAFVLSSLWWTSPHILSIAFGVTIRVASMRNRHLVVAARLAILLE